MTAGFQFIRSFLTGFSQIMLQSNSLTGLFFLAAIAVNSVPMCLAAVAGSLTAYLGAWASGAGRAHLEQGLYGYNGALVGLACALYWPAGTELLVILPLAALVSTGLMRLFVERLFFQRISCPAYTAPFILSIWLVASAVEVEPASTVVVTRSGIDNLLLGFGQVLLLDQPIASLLILVGLAFASRRALCWGAVAVVLSSGGAFLLGGVPEDIFSGAYAYNAVLVAIALSARAELGVMVVFAAILLSVILTGWLQQCGVPVLTAPFVISSWLALLLSSLSATFTSPASY
ncbi:transporter [Marinobacterium zhoushanense]|uniref:Transporter n=1 Tax=Marinobacterium zhoushanense TaxID=1679163 RepID=A0ABQ1JYY3_9GAMM|nr:urea transporter [Marinobacterium zhoushanense]GGB81214.1 transporter [Marinobacterium zhoushanense]